MRQGGQEGCGDRPPHTHKHTKWRQLKGNTGCLTGACSAKTQSPWEGEGGRVGGRRWVIYHTEGTPDVRCCQATFVHLWLDTGRSQDH